MSGHYFKHLRKHRGGDGTGAAVDAMDLPALLAVCVLEPFGRMTADRLTAVLLSPTAGLDGDEPEANPGHPACAEHSGSDYCRESWQYHLAELARRPRTHWHRCDFDRSCALVPVICEETCLVVVKVACDSSMSDEEFESHVQLLDGLIEGFCIAHAEFLGRVEPRRRESAEAAAADVHEPARSQRRPHPQVLRALERIDKRLCDPKLTVGAIARELDIDPSYLGSIFVEQTGRRMSWFIASRRVELAKRLLVETDRQVKVIARDTGHANPNWFCHVFRVHTGLTPNGYRRRFGGRPSPPAGP